MDKLDMQTKNLAEEKYEALRELFPNAVTETINENGEIVKAIDKDILMQEISSEVVEGREERYQFTWPDKRKAILTASAPISKTLRPCREESVDFDETKNLYIEGDNLEVLKLLQETYLGKIKMIYIDPPYNTGSDFIYNDDFKKTTEEYLDHSGQYDEEGNRLEKNQETNGRFHTDWLNMMYPRLKLARSLLSDEGVIFISIDENEVSNMQKICNEIFGEKNYASTFLWTKTSTPPALSYKCRKTVEYVLAYEKKSNSLKYFGSFLDNGDAPLLNTGNPIKTLRFPKGSVRFNFIKNGTIEAGKKDKATLENDIVVLNGENENEFELTAHFKWGQDTLNNEIVLGTYFLIKTDKFSIRFQRVESEDSYKTPTNFMNIELNRSNGVLTNESAVKELNEIGLTDYFDYPKPVSLVKSLCSMVCKFDKDALVLDFFAGSSTTAHAVMDLNSEDSGSREFVLVQIPEEIEENSKAFKAGYKFITEIGKERIRRTGKKIVEDNPDKEGIENLDIGFRVLKTDTSNMKDVFYSPNNTEQDQLDMLEDNIKEDRSPEDLLFQVMLDLGVSLSSQIKVETIGGKQVYMVEDNFLIACFDKDVNEETVKEIAKREPYYAVFRDASMASDSVATNFEQIFESISPETIRRVV